MKNPSKAPDKESGGDMQDEYDFSKGVRGKYAARYAEGTNMVLLDPEIAQNFPNSASVNDALRDVLKRNSKRPEKGAARKGLRKVRVHQVRGSFLEVQADDRRN